MLIEIPDPEVILGVILAFLIGLGGLYFFLKIRPFIKSSSDVADPTQVERLEYYERQLIDMKIRLDSLEIQGVEENPIDPNLELKQFIEKLVETKEPEKEIKVVKEPEIVLEKQISTPNLSNIEPVSPVDYVLQLITNKAMTSRDIQITTKRSREHTSRLMKKLFESGLVQRNTETKPYSYSITEKGKEKINDITADQVVG
ncbi:MAG: winged helix DNA-binding protein [Nitrosopumilus sp.]|nr:MarR family transcriptional regulator [Nitrosopumilus sp.]MDC4229214.1 winged helix DNA-binding protein [Nitrosopumilus sp.]MDC4229732.1 winged helix DNA-binding protein [Nitrosopumilus sp.]